MHVPKFMSFRFEPISSRFAKRKEKHSSISFISKQVWQSSTDQMKNIIHSMKITPAQHKCRWSAGGRTNLCTIRIDVDGRVKKHIFYVMMNSVLINRTGRTPTPSPCDSRLWRWVSGQSTVHNGDIVEIICHTEANTVYYHIYFILYCIHKRIKPYLVASPLIKLCSWQQNMKRLLLLLWIIFGSTTFFKE